MGRQTTEMFPDNEEMFRERQKHFEVTAKHFEGTTKHFRITANIPVNEENIARLRRIRFGQETHGKRRMEDDKRNRDDEC